MVDLEDEQPLAEDYHDVLRFPLPPEKSQPFLFRQYSVSEFITPSQKGNVAVKEVSFSVSSTGAWSPHYFGRGTSAPSVLGDSKSKNMMKSLLFTQVAQANQPEEQERQSFALPNNSVVLRSKHQNNSPASKRMKVDACDKERKTSNRNLRHVAKDRIKKEQRVKSLHWKYVLMISLLPLLSLSCIIYLASPLFGNDFAYEGKNLKELADVLEENVLGQEEPIASLLNILNRYFSKKGDVEGKVPVILMTGSSGVGKSFVSSIIARNFPPPGKTELVLLPLPPPDNVLQKFTRHGHNLIVVDSLNPTSVLDVQKWIQNVKNEATWQRKPLIVILVFNLQMWHGDVRSEDDDDLFIRNLRLKGDATYAAIQSAGYDLYHIHFNLLTKDHIQECIRRDLRKQGVEEAIVVENYVQAISRNINVKYDGCKPVWSKTASVAAE